MKNALIYRHKNAWAPNLEFQALTWVRTPQFLSFPLKFRAWSELVRMAKEDNSKAKKLTQSVAVEHRLQASHFGVRNSLQKLMFLEQVRTEDLDVVLGQLR